MQVIFFRNPAALRKWFEKNSAKAVELWVGYYKRGSGKESVTWPESVDEALCVGWIDGVRKTIDDESYQIRFSPRRPSSIWSAVNIGRVAQLESDGRMLPAGLKAFEARREYRSGIYSYENRPHELDEPYLGILKKSKAAWRGFQGLTPSNRRKYVWWIISAKREETRLKRLELMIKDLESGNISRLSISKASPDSPQRTQSAQRRRREKP